MGLYNVSVVVGGGVVEIKCPYSYCHRHDAVEIIALEKQLCLVVVEDGTLQLN